MRISLAESGLSQGLVPKIISSKPLRRADFALSTKSRAAVLQIMERWRLLAVLREDNRAIVRAASQASKAADFLLGFLPGDTQAHLAAAATGEVEAA
jgi:antirestriction protein ArdC